MAEILGLWKEGYSNISANVIYNRTLSALNILPKNNQKLLDKHSSCLTHCFRLPVDDKKLVLLNHRLFFPPLKRREGSHQCHIYTVSIVSDTITSNTVKSGKDEYLKPWSVKSVVCKRDFWFTSNYILERNSIYSKPLFNTLKKVCGSFSRTELLNGKHLFSPLKKFFCKNIH